MRTLLCSLAVVAGLAASAQITLETTTPARLYGLRGLPDGNKYWSSNTSGFVLYNTDLSVYQAVTYPAPPAGWTYGAVPYYITATLFDTDASTIEFVAQLVNGGVLGVRIMRTDGTILLEDLVHGAVSATSEPYGLFTGIISTDNGTVMLVGQGSQGETALYHLPGTMPCLECDGISTGGLAPQDPSADPAGPEATAFPNPANGSVRFTCTIPAGVDHVTLHVTDATGRVVRTMPVQGTGTVELNLADQAAGNYLYALNYANGRTTAKQLLVIGAGR